jgi:hypothetical protein
MAQRVQVHLIDDLNGQEAEETIRFGLDGSDFEIDLTTENAARLRSVLSKYMDKARKAPAVRKSGLHGTSTLRSKRDELQQIRQWAQENGHNPSSRGRISQSIMDAYSAVTRGSR